MYSWQCTNIYSCHSGCGESAILQWQASILQQGKQFCLSSCLFCRWMEDTSLTGERWMNGEK